MSKSNVTPSGITFRSPIRAAARSFSDDFTIRLSVAFATPSCSGICRVTGTRYPSPSSYQQTVAVISTSGDASAMVWVLTSGVKSVCCMTVWVCCPPRTARTTTSAAAETMSSRSIVMRLGR